MRRMIALLAGLGSAVLMAACGGGGNGNSITIISGAIAFFVVRSAANQDTVSVLAGNPVQLQGVAFDGGMNPIALVGDTVWTSRDESVATVDAHGLVTTVVPGSTWVVGSFTPKTSQQSFSDSVLIQSLGPN